MESYLQVIKGQLHGLSYQECKLQLTQIVYRLMRTFKQLGELQGMDGIRQYLDRFSSLQDVMRWIKHELNEIIRELNPTQKSNRKEELYREMIEYVKQHIFDPMLTVEELAEHISISGDYARKIFKRFPRAFTVRLHDLRKSRACEKNAAGDNHAGHRYCRTLRISKQKPFLYGF